MKLAAAFVLALAAWPATAATSWRMDPAASTLTFTATQAGARFTGRFAQFSADIVFDGRELADSRFEVRIATASADSHDEQRDDLLRGQDFFWSEAYPEALFVADEFVAAADGGVALGHLTLRGVTRRVPVRFQFLPLANGSARLEGTAVLKRLDFGVGQGEWSGTVWVGDMVEIEFDLRLTAIEPDAGEDR